MEVEGEILVVKSVLRIQEARSRLEQLARSDFTRDSSLLEMMAETIQRLELQNLDSNEGVCNALHSCRRLLEICVVNLLQQIGVAIPMQSKLRSRISWIQGALTMMTNDCTDFFRSLNPTGLDHIREWCALANKVLPVLHRASHIDRPISIACLDDCLQDMHALFIRFRDCHQFLKVTFRQLIFFLSDRRRIPGYDATSSRKRKICSFSLSSECSNFDCNFAHSYAELKIHLIGDDEVDLDPSSSPSFAGVYPPSTFMNVPAPSTTPSHMTVPANDDLPQRKYKTRLCKHFQQGLCSRGDECGFAHGENQLVHHPPTHRN